MSEQKSSKNARLHSRNYRHSEMLIRGYLDKTLASGAPLGTVTLVCQSIDITRATFYNHHCNLGEAIKDYEAALLGEFQAKAAPFINSRNTERAFEMLLLFIHQHEEHFAAAYSAAHFRTFYMFIDYLRPALPRLSEHHYIIYRCLLTTILHVWMVEDSFDKKRIPYCISRMMRARNMIGKIAG